jgi:hypothetical protein
MASERLIQDKRESTQEDSIENGAADQELFDRTQEKQKKAKKSVNSGDTTASISHPTAVKQLESLSQLLQGDLSAVDPDAVLEIVDDLHGLVQQFKQPGAKELAASLKELQKLFKRKEPTGHNLGELLSELGEQTSSIAHATDPDLKTPLQHLGKQLTKVGRSLCKTEDLEHVAELEGLLKILEQKYNEIDTKPAVNEIDRWYDLLHKSEDDSLQAIATQLKELKHLLKSNKTTGADISKKLLKIGEHTTEAATNASRGFKGILQKLGKALTVVSQTIK